MRFITSTLKTYVISAMCGILILLPTVSTYTIPNRCQTTRQDKKCRQLHGLNYWNYNEECKTPKEICPNKYTHYDRCDSSQPCKPCDSQWWNPHYQLTCTKRRVSPGLIPKEKNKKNATEATIPLFNSTLAPEGENTSSHVTTGSPMLPYTFEERINTTLNPQLVDDVTFNTSDPNQINTTIPIPGGPVITPIGIVMIVVASVFLSFSIYIGIRCFIKARSSSTARSPSLKEAGRRHASGEYPESEEETVPESERMLLSSSV